MPNVLRFKAYRFFFYSNEGDPLEPPHIHVRSPLGEAKSWLSPEVALADSAGFDARTLRDLAAIIRERRPDF